MAFPQTRMRRLRASAGLRGLVRELLVGAHAYFFPSEALFAWRDGPGGPIVPWLETARDKMGDGDGPMAIRSAYGPVPRPHEYPIPEEAVARAMFDRRLGAIFEKRRQEP